jgi:hypothetical protein
MHLALVLGANINADLRATTTATGDDPLVSAQTELRSMNDGSAPLGRCSP